jgi:CHAT domain-containing protein/Tfp pilus assembly protein PilF
MVASVWALFAVLTPAQDPEARSRCLAAYRQAEALWAKGKFREAIPPYETAVALAPRAFGARSKDTANLQNNLAQLYMHTGQYAKAEPLFRTSLQTREDLLGKDHLLVAQGLNNLAELYRHTGRYDEAEPLYRRSLKIKQAKDARSLTVAFTLNNLALLYKETGRYEQAARSFRRSLDILEAGKPGPDLATTLDNLAQVYVWLGEDEKAEPLLRRSLRLYEQNLPKDHPDIAVCLNSHAFLYHRQLGQLDRAEPLYLRCLAIQEKRLGENHPNVAQTLENLAVLYQDRGEYPRAERFFLRSLKIRRDRLPADHPDLAQSLNDLGFLYLQMGHLDQAGPLLRESRKRTETKFGPDHPRLTTTLNNLGILRFRQGRPGEAEALFQRSLKVREKVNSHHPEVALSLGKLAQVYAATKSWSKALAAADRDLHVLRGYAGRVLSSLPEHEQLTFLHSQLHGEFRTALSLGLARAADAEAAEMSAAWVLNGKGLVHQTLAERVLLSRDGRDEKVAGVVRQLLAVRRRLANLTWQGPAGEGGVRRKLLAQLAGQEQELSRELGQQTGRPAGANDWVELGRVRQKLPGDAVLVELARFTPRDFQAARKAARRSVSRYVAWVIPAPGRGSIRVIDLGEAGKIEAAVLAARQAIREAPRQLRQQGEPASEKHVRQSLQALSRLLLQPLAGQLGPARRWVLSPDADLWLVPWAALPLADGKYAVEDHDIRYVVSGRDLLGPGAGTVKTTRALVMADPDYDLGPRELRAEARRLVRDQPRPDGLRGRDHALTLPSVPRLPGTAAEARAILPGLQKYAGARPRLYTDRQALEGVFKAVRSPRAVILATHGFFLEGTARTSTGPAEQVNPLLRCGLLLAGCNRRNAARGPEEEDGVLTGLEIVGTDLRGTDLVVLSACETGLGKVNVGEGVAGLRQAFQLAGARSVVASLWQVSDRETARLMRDFFAQLAGGRDRADALCQAQRALIKARRGRSRAAHPFFWAAFTLTGQGE